MCSNTNIGNKVLQYHYKSMFVAIQCTDAKQNLSMFDSQTILCCKIVQALFLSRTTSPYVVMFLL